MSERAPSCSVSSSSSSSDGARGSGSTVLRRALRNQKCSAPHCAVGSSSPQPVNIGTSRSSNIGHRRSGLPPVRTTLCGGCCSPPPEPEIQGTCCCIAGDCSSRNPQNQGCARARETTLSFKTAAASER